MWQRPLSPLLLLCALSFCPCNCVNATNHKSQALLYKDVVMWLCASVYVIVLPCVCACVLFFYRHFDCLPHGKHTDTFADTQFVYKAALSVYAKTLNQIFHPKQVWCVNFVIEGCPHRHYIFLMACCEMELFLVNIQNINLFTWCVA